MEDTEMNEETKKSEAGMDISAIIRSAVQEFARSEHRKAEPAYKAELLEERKRREELERRLNELVEENKRTRAAAEEAERSAAIRAELQRLGVAKVDLAYQAVQDDISRAEDGRLVAQSGAGDQGMKEYPGAVRERESGVSAGADRGRVGGGIGAQVGAGRKRHRPGTDPAGHERGGDAAGARGDRARGVADPARAVRRGPWTGRLKRQKRDKERQEQDGQQLLQQT